MVGALGPLVPPPEGPPSMFLELMVGTPGPPAPPPKRAAIDVFCIDGGRIRTFGTVSQGARHQHFLC
jgi:hypothetical protein